MSAGSGNAVKLAQIDSMAVADLRTAIALERAASSAWQSIAQARGITIEELRKALERYQSRSRN